MDVYNRTFLSFRFSGELWNQKSMNKRTIFGYYSIFTYKKRLMVGKIRNYDSKRIRI